MKDDNQVITPNEINKYTYCPFQWYYERYYGKAALRAKAQERNSALRLTDTRQSHFVAGNKYHEKVYQQVKKRKSAVLVAIGILVAVFFLILIILIKG